MPKVLRIINRFNLGGPTYNAAYLTKYMAPDYETLLVGGMHDESEGSSKFILDNLDIEPVLIPEMKRELNFKEDRIAFGKIKNLIKEFQPDIVHTHASKAGALGRLAAHQLGVKGIVHTFHGHVFHSYFGTLKTQFYKNIERYLAKKSSKIIAISEIQKKELSIDHRICSADKINVIPLGFDLSRFKENQIEKRLTFRKKWNISNDEIAVGIIGRLVPIKDHHFFIDVIESVIKKTTQKLRFFIIGDGEYKQSIIEYIKEKKLPYSESKENVQLITFTSWIKEVDIANAGLDIICLSSKNEGTPVSLIEAQSSLKPIISTRVGGIDNVVLENKTALLSDVGDLTSYSNNLIQLINNPNQRKEFSAAGNHIFQKFNYNRLVNDMNILYQSIL
tara:strand:- start:68 stop:1240 length:1173 start_codon:yes stop_codon:yes gene_type:complete